MGNPVPRLSSGIAALALVACSGVATPVDNGPTVQVAQASATRVPAASIAPQSLAAAVTANNAFALDLYARVSANSGSSNLMTSPLSASLALTMTYAGAAGQTASEMASALHLGAAAGQTIFDGQNALTQAIAMRGPAALAAAQAAPPAGGPAPQPSPKPSDYDLRVVNAVWGDKTVAWAGPFLNTLATSYGSGVYLQDFIGHAEQARLAINDWVRVQTSSRINNLLPQGSIDQTTRIVLVDAFHLKFPWATPFDPSATAAGTFTRSDGTTVSPSFMNQTTQIAYADDGQAQVAWLPLSNNQISVVIALPHAGVDLATYEQSLTAMSAAIVQPTSTALVALGIPKATFTSNTFSLAGALKAMGMMQAFGPTADFSGMGSGVYLSDVFQKAMISMQEAGVEAAAATGVVADATAAAASPPVPMIVDRPYLVGIVDATGAVLALGHIVDPTDSGSP
jgi:serpin B